MFGLYRALSEGPTASLWKRKTIVRSSAVNEKLR